MNRFVAAMACAVTVAVVHPGAAVAQASKAAPAAASPPPVSPAPAAVSPAPVPAASRAETHANERIWTRADARACLEFPTNLQIIRCAEKYRYTRVPI
jgi:hypothetical protein